jgi:hypothetical protein
MINTFIKSFNKTIQSITNLFTSANKCRKDEPGIDQNQEYYSDSFLNKGKLLKNQLHIFFIKYFLFH